MDIRMLWDIGASLGVSHLIFTFASADKTDKTCVSYDVTGIVMMLYYTGTNLPTTSTQV